MLDLLQIHKPHLSIILPTYNRANFLGQAIESVLEQSFTDFEIIVINDGSTDASEEVINSYRDSRIVYVRQPNQGEYSATNTGLRMAQGQLVTWIHSDDIMTPQSLSARVTCLNDNREVDFCHGDIAVSGQ
ncbi:MAG TPA: glycosyltransferase family A protein [Candidatus Saccharimonadales bacterium]|nr:glycosyltransferase family A protein [Candidatus Saccharimonadales bacterium]